MRFGSIKKIPKQEFPEFPSWNAVVITQMQGASPLKIEELITEKVEESSNRVDIGEDGYLLEIDTPDHLNDDDIVFYSSQFLFQIKEPEIQYGSPEFDLISDHISLFESALFGSNFKDPIIGYRAFIDLESFIDWYLINEIAKNVDARSYSSIYMTYKPGEKIKMGPLWDFDLSFGNVDYADSQYTDGWWIMYNNYFERMFEDPYFVSQVKNRFNYFMGNKDYFMDLKRAIIKEISF